MYMCSCYSRVVCARLDLEYSEHCRIRIELARDTVFRVCTDRLNNLVSTWWTHRAEPQVRSSFGEGVASFYRSALPSRCAVTHR